MLAGQSMICQRIIHQAAANITRLLAADVCEFQDSDKRREGDRIVCIECAARLSNEEIMMYAALEIVER
jgi:hypothetical protein